MYTLTTGVELELWVVNERGRLCDGTEVIEAHPRIEPEFINPLIEVKTEPHTSERDLRRDLQSVLQTAILAAEGASKRLVPLGTPLTEADPPANCERGRVFETVYGDGVRSAKNCAGTHIHFEREDAVDQLNLLTALDPALALTSSSPYYAGERRANSARARSRIERTAETSSAVSRTCGSMRTASPSGGTGSTRSTSGSSGWPPTAGSPVRRSKRCSRRRTRC